MQPLAFVDLETTGAAAAVDRITEVGIIEVDDAGVREWSSLVNPQCAIPTFIQAMTGISNTMVRQAPTFAELADEVLARLQGRLFIAHNARFDHGFLKNELLRLGRPFRPTVLCTVKLSRKFFPEQRRHGLDALIERHGLQVDGRHRALADAQLIHQFWNRMRASQDEEYFAAAIEELTAQPSLPPQLDPALLEQLPEAPGSYLIYGDGPQPLQQGQVRNIRRSVLAQFPGKSRSAKKTRLAELVRRIEWIPQ